jgi:hypothetical protein
MMRGREFKRGLVLCTLLLSACGIDPGDLAAGERADVSSALVVGAPFRVVSSQLAKLKYNCQLASGQFQTETRETRTAPSFLDCSKNLKGEGVCGIRMEVIVVPVGETIGSLDIQQHDVCL